MRVDTPLHLVTTNPTVAHIRYGPCLGWCLCIALTPPLYSYPVCTPTGMVLAHGIESTMAFVSDMEAIMDMAPGPRGQGPRRLQRLLRATSKRHPSPGPYRIRVQLAGLDMDADISSSGSHDVSSAKWRGCVDSFFLHEFSHVSGCPLSASKKASREVSLSSERLNCRSRLLVLFSWSLAPLSGHSTHMWPL